jgi:uncharacterized protein (TIGR01244 family)
MHSKINNLIQAGHSRWVAGQPNEEDLKELSEKGVAVVVNLRPRSEWPFDEANVAQRVGLIYHHMPIGGATDITVDNAGELHNLLATIGDENTLVHCASGNRVGALIALAAATQDGLDLEAAVEIGRRWGLAGLKSVVVDQIQEFQHRQTNE